MSAASNSSSSSADAAAHMVAVHGMPCCQIPGNLFHYSFFFLFAFYFCCSRSTPRRNRRLVHVLTLSFELFGRAMLPRSAYIVLSLWALGHMFRILGPRPTGRPEKLVGYGRFLRALFCVTLLDSWERFSNQVEIIKAPVLARVCRVRTV